jgi:hypothetical protein
MIINVRAVIYALGRARGIAKAREVGITRFAGSFIKKEAGATGI